MRNDAAISARAAGATSTTSAGEVAGSPSTTAGQPGAAYRPSGYCRRCDYPVSPGVCPECGLDNPRPRRRARSWWFYRIRRIVVRFALTAGLLYGVWLGCAAGVYRLWPGRSLQEIAVRKGLLAERAHDILAWRLRREREAGFAVVRRLTASIAERSPTSWSGRYYGIAGEDFVIADGEYASIAWAVSRTAGAGVVMTAPPGPFDLYNLAVTNSDFGTVRLEDDRWRFCPRVPTAALFRAVGMPSDFIRFRWGPRCYLLQRADVPELRPILQSGKAWFDWPVFRRLHDVEAPVSGLPEAPPELRHLLPEKLDLIRVVRVAEDPDRSPNGLVVELDGGLERGVNQGMRVCALFGNFVATTVVDAWIGGCCVELARYGADTPEVGYQFAIPSAP